MHGFPSPTPSLWLTMAQDPQNSPSSQWEIPLHLPSCQAQVLLGEAQEQRSNQGEEGVQEQSSIKESSCLVTPTHWKTVSGTAPAPTVVSTVWAHPLIPSAFTCVPQVAGY